MNESASNSGAHKKGGELLSMLREDCAVDKCTFTAHQELIDEVFDQPIFINRGFFDRGLTIRGCTFNKGLKISACFEVGLKIIDSRLSGNVVVEIWSVSTKNVTQVDFTACKIQNHLYFAPIAAASCVAFRRCKVGGLLEISRGHSESRVHLTFSSQILSGGHLCIRDTRGTPSDFSPGAYSLQNLGSEGSVDDTFNLDHSIVDDNARISISHVQGGCVLLLRKISIAEKGRIDISDSNLALAPMTGTNLDRVSFNRVNWPQTKRNRSAILDDPNVSKHELAIRCEPENAERYFEDVRATELTESYRQLITQMEFKREFEVAEDFYINEMETRRTHFGDVRRGWFSRNLNVTALYKYASMYGASYGRAASILAALIVMFSAAFLFAGMRVVNPQTNQETLVEYGSAAYRSQLRPGDVVRDAMLAAALTFSIATLQKDKPATPVGIGGSIIASAATVMLTAQGALLLFALRRRFRRSSI